MDAQPTSTLSCQGGVGFDQHKQGKFIIDSLALMVQYMVVD